MIEDEGLTVRVVMPRGDSHAIANTCRVAMTPEELTGAARKLSHSLGITVYIRDGRIYQNLRCRICRSCTGFPPTLIP